MAVRPGAGFAELELTADTEPSAILAAAMARDAHVTRFEVAEPSLEAIFIERVGRSAGDEATLAAADGLAAADLAAADPADNAAA